MLKLPLCGNKWTKTIEKKREIQNSDGINRPHSQTLEQSKTPKTDCQKTILNVKKSDLVQSKQVSDESLGKSKSTKKRKPVEKALTPDTPIPKDGKEFKAFLDVKENKTSLQSLIGETLIENAPPNKVVVVSGAFEDSLEVRV